ncbi:hypothetical protein [Streptomyces aureus]
MPVSQAAVSDVMSAIRAVEGAVHFRMDLEAPIALTGTAAG